MAAGVGCARPLPLLGPGGLALGVALKVASLSLRLAPPTWLAGTPVRATGTERRVVSYVRAAP